MHKKHESINEIFIRDSRAWFFMEPKELWDGDLNFELTIVGWSHYGHATDLHTRNAVCVHVTEWNGMSVVIKSRKSQTAAS